MKVDIPLDGGTFALMPPVLDPPKDDALIAEFAAMNARL
jgi:hypothetical protein